MLITHPSRDLVVTLPNEGPFGPISITARADQRILICDHKGRPVCRQIAEGESATFKLKEAPWWVFWRGPRWVKTDDVL